ncbi:MAG: DUF4254 domain-containing protein [Phycisphaeraceae bacterium]
MLDIPTIHALHEETVARWHREPVDNPYKDLLAVVCQQHAFNFNLWHEEDKARSPSATDATLAQVKRNIDKLNQQRNDWIEKIDEWLINDLLTRGITPGPDAPLNTETPGSATDRLSILSLRIFHLREQSEDASVTPERRAAAAERLPICLQQQKDLGGSLAQLVADIDAGRKRLRVYRQMKLYNDPRFNAYLAGTKAATPGA